MRRLKRSGYVVPVLADSGIAGRKKIQHRRKYEDLPRRQIPTEFEPYWINPQVRGLLDAMQGRICAYCLTEASRRRIFSSQKGLLVVGV